MVWGEGGTFFKWKEISSGQVSYIPVYSASKPANLLVWCAIATMFVLPQVDIFNFGKITIANLLVATDGKLVLIYN